MKTYKVENIRKNIMGTVSFELKTDNMRKSQNFIVYPIRDKNSVLKFQSDKRFIIFQHEKQRGIINRKNIDYPLPQHALADGEAFILENWPELQQAINKTQGVNVGNKWITCDNSAAGEV